MLFCACCPKYQTNWFENKVKSFSRSFIKLDDFADQGLQNLHGQAVLFYEDLPMVIVQVCIISGAIDMGEIMDASPSVVYFGLSTTVLSIFVAFLIWYIESRAIDATMTQLSFENMTARVSWIPFQKSLVKCEKTLNINYGMIDAPLPYASERLGIYKRVLFQFNRKTFQTFTALIADAQPKLGQLAQ